MASESSFFKKITYIEGLYPSLNISLPKNPNRFFAVPFFGILIKSIFIIPVAIVLILLGLWVFIAIVLINPWIVLVTGKYWSVAFSASLEYLRLSAKMSSYLYGLTDKYPFGSQDTSSFSLDLTIPQSPNKLYAVPLIGGLIRIILLIPYRIFEQIINLAVCIGVFILAWAVVLFKGQYPEGIAELARDSIRISSSSGAYMLGLSDKYPSFYFSMAHDKIKLILIAVAIILSGWNLGGQVFNSNNQSTTTPVANQYLQK